MPTKKILLITNIPNPYRVPLFNELNRQAAEAGWAFKVIFGRETYARRKFILDPSTFKFDHTVLGSSTVSGGDQEKTRFLYNGLSAALRHEKPDVIITSGFSSATLQVMVHQLRFGTPFIIWNGSILSPSRPDTLLRKRWRKIVAARASAFVAYGSSAKNYLRGLGAADHLLFTAINTVDTGFFRDETARLRSSGPPGDGKHHLLYTGYLSARKQTGRLLDVMKLVNSVRPDVVLDIVGEGDERAMLEERVRLEGLSETVRFHGFRQKEELPRYMANASVYLFQTGFDIWGLVLNEAMAAGLPVICSPNAGAAADLIQEGVTGFIMDYDQPDAVSKKVLHLLDHPEEAGRIGREAATFISRHASLEVSARGFMDAIRKVIG